MKITMRQNEGSSNSHKIEVDLESGECISISVIGIQEAIDVYKALVLAYERGRDDESSLRTSREAQTRKEATLAALQEEMDKQQNAARRGAFFPKRTQT